MRPSTCQITWSMWRLSYWLHVLGMINNPLIRHQLSFCLKKFRNCFNFNVNVNVRHTYWAPLNPVTEVLHAVELTLFLWRMPEGVAEHSYNVLFCFNVYYLQHARKRNFHKRNFYIGQKRNAKESKKAPNYFVLSLAFGVGSFLTEIHRCIFGRKLALSDENCRRTQILIISKIYVRRYTSKLWCHTPSGKPPNIIFSVHNIFYPSSGWEGASFAKCLSMGTPTIHRSTIIVSSVILSSLTIDSSIALIVWVNGCGGTASNSTRRRPSSFGWGRSVILPPVPSAPSLSMEKLFSHHSQFAIWASSSIRPCRRAGQDLLFPDSTASFDTKITDHWVLPRPCPCNDPIAIGLLQRSTWRGPEEPTRPALQRHEGCCTTYSGAPSAESRDQRNLCEAALAWYAVESSIQALLPCVPVSTQFSSPVSGGILHSSQLFRQEWK